MPTPRDPDTEDKRNDRDLDEESPEEKERDEEDTVVSSEVRLFDDPYDDDDMVDFDLDDLREMEGPDA